MDIKEYCVYTHRDMNKQIFYVGMGSGERPFNVYKSNRTQAWHDHVEQYGLGSIDIIAWYDNKEEALACEEEFTLLLKDFGEPLVNIKLGNKFERPEDSPMFGKEHSEDTKKKISEAEIGTKHPGCKGVWVGIRHRDKSTIAFVGYTDIKNRGYHPSSISESVRGVYAGDKNNYRKYTWSQTLDKEYLKTLLEQDNFVDEESKIVIAEFLDL